MRKFSGDDHLQASGAAITIRRLDGGGADRAALGRLAERDSRAPLEGTVLGLEIEGSLLAAIGLESGEVIADPFSRTVELRSLLELRAAQLRRRGRGVRRHASRHRPGPSRATLAASPPGAGGRLLELPR